ncbi:MAG TPA: NADP-dependent oxidoreductase [Candidatus Polarisedimenticolia bacterium]|nr:NADP-dependent oxidoreductase [Candidatus Polarisedimenticolia bacterium]
MNQRDDTKTTMKAVRIHAFGGPEVLQYEDAPRPVADAGEVLIRIHASAVNPADWKFRNGYFGKDARLPITLGFDFSGVIEALGEGVTRWKTGDEVYGYSLGAYAEYIAVKETLVAAKPKTVDHIHAAAIASASLAAWKALFEAGGLRPGQKVLIHGATGGVGGFAVQLAHAKGARVIGTASKRNQSYLKELGADEAIDYESVRFEDVVRDVDVVFDTQGGATQSRSWKTLKRGGILVSIAQPPAPEEAEKHGVRAVFMVNEMKAESLNAITKLVDSGELKAVVDTVLPLSEARRAQELIQTGHTRGKIALKVV